MSLRYKAGFITESYDPLLVPDAPTIGTATAGSGSASVTFTAPSNVGGGAITGYIATAYDSSGNAISTTGSSSPITVTGLTNNTAYTIKVAATNAYGTGAYSAASNSVTPVPPFIEEVFSTYLYTGNGGSQTITNGIDLSGNGGLVWHKCRNAADGHILVDTVRGGNKYLQSQSTAAEGTQSIYSFLSNGYTISAQNTNGQTYVDWTFREQPKFFDVVTYTGNGGTLAVNHSLASSPGCIIIKRTSNVASWMVYHRSLTDPTRYYLSLNLTNAQADWGSTWITATSTSFTLSGANGLYNGSGDTYVAYLFAHDAGGFGASGTDNVISCGSYVGTTPIVNLGYEPQFVMTKLVSSTDNWMIADIMRGTDTANTNRLYPNNSDAEAPVNAPYIVPTATGFNGFNQSAGTFIYIAIRRGPMKTPTTGTSVFSPQAITGSTAFTTGFPVDLAIFGNKQGTTSNFMTSDRLRGSSAYLRTTNTDQEGDTTSTYATVFDNNTGSNYKWWNSSINLAGWNFKRAPGFFDVVCYTGTGTNATRPHNLGVAPEMMIVKKRGGVANWAVYHSALSADGYVILNTTAASTTASTFWQSTTPTATNFYTGTNGNVGDSGLTYVAYLFASCPGVSKVGSYTGTGTTQTINCGFTTGARFVMIKRTDSTGDWYVWDSARGIVAGNDPYLLLNSTAAEVTNTDYIDTANAGFEISSTAPAAINANGGTFIYLAIA